LQGFFFHAGPVRMLLTQQAHAVVQLHGDRVCIQNCNWVFYLQNYRLLANAFSRNSFSRTFSFCQYGHSWVIVGTFNSVELPEPRISVLYVIIGFIQCLRVYLYLSMCGISKDMSLGLCTWQLYAGGHDLGSLGCRNVLFTGSLLQFVS
jgi:hypothetical protein